MKLAVSAALIVVASARQSYFGCDGKSAKAESVGTYDFLAGDVITPMGNAAPAAVTTIVDEEIEIGVDAKVSVTLNVGAGTAVWLPLNCGTLSGAGWTAQTGAGCDTNQVMYGAGSSIDITGASTAMACTEGLRILTADGQSQISMQQVTLSIVAGVGGTAAPGDEDGQKENSECTAFCTRLQATCTGGNAQHATQAECELSCSVHTRTMLDGAFLGDTFECRNYHLDVSQTLPDAHCVHAGKTGGGVCVATDPCVTFCKTFADVTCKADVEHDPEYDTPENCLETCQAYPQTGLVGAVSGDTFQCREYHLGVAYRELKQDPNNPSDAVEAHCQHARKPASRHCVKKVTACEAFCSVWEMYCDGTAGATPYTDCVTQCAEFPTNGKLNDVAGDTLQCREYHLGVAALGRGASPTVTSTHCPHAQADGGDVCSKKVGNGAMSSRSVIVAFASTLLLAAAL